MNKQRSAVLASLMMVIAGNSQADAYVLPIALDYSLIKNALSTQLYKGQGNTAELWNDKKGCSYFRLSHLKVSGYQEQIKLVNNVQAQLGTKFGGQCIKLLEWQGLLETLQRPTINADQSILSLPVTQIKAMDNAGRLLTNNDLQALIKRVAEPQLAAVKIDLNASRKDIEKSVTEFLPKENTAEVKAILETLKFTHAAANDKGIALQLGFDAANKSVANQTTLPLNAAEQKQWQATWQQWDDFLTKAISKAADDTQSPELRDTLMQILLESRAAIKQAMTAKAGQGGEDPVKVLFIETWQRLAPELKTLANELPELQALRYMTFITATDVLYELENRGAPLGLSVSSDGLRRLARMLMVGKQQDEAK